MLWKPPILGQTKTRLAQSLGLEKTLELYAAMLDDLELSLQQACGQMEIVSYQSEPRKSFSQWPTLSRNARPQPEGDLGVRMRTAFEEAWQENEEIVVLIGSDTPGQGPNLWLKLGDQCLQHGAVLGPAEDGGYWAIGFQRQAWIPEVFEDMPWSSAQVSTRTLSVMEQGGLKPALAERRRDVDTLEDVQILAKERVLGPQACRVVQRWKWSSVCET